MADLKLVADIVTTLRGFMAFVLVWIGIVVGKDGLTTVVYIMIGCWMGDFIDGRLARVSGVNRQTWIGSHDLQIDLFVSLGLGAYLIWSGFISNLYSFIYIFIWGVLIWKKGPDRNLLMLFQCPIYLILIYLSLLYIPDDGKWILVLVGIILIINGKAFIKDIIPGFITGMLNLFKTNGTSKM